MRELSLVMPPDTNATYLRLAEALRQALREQQLAPGELLPSTRTLAAQVGVHRHTVMTALEELVAEGRIESEPGRGYRVADSVPLELALPETQPAEPGFAWEVVRQVQLPQPFAAARFQFPSGQPDLRLFPAGEYYQLMREVLRSAPAPALLGYSEADGGQHLREQLAVYLRRMRGLTSIPDTDQVVITHGSQEAIFLLGQLLVRPDQTVAVEELGYPPAWAALRAAGGVLKPIRVDAEGADPDSLEAILKGGDVGLIYLTPLHQYPSTVTLSRARRLAIYSLSVRYQVPILEDDYDHEFHYRCQPLPPMKAEDPHGLVLYCSTFSKVLYPAARLGFAVVPRALAPALGALKQVVSRQNDNLTQEVVARWMETGGLERHLRRMRRIYARRMEAMLACLGQGSRAYGLELTVTEPDGGMCLWVSLGVDAQDLVTRAARLDLSVRGSAAFRLHPDAPGTRYLRLGFAANDEEEIREGVARLCQAAAG